jgi:hypothetical protein
MPTAAAIVRRESKPDDLVVNFHFMNQQSFQYYYNYNTTVRQINDHPSENLWFDTHTNIIPDNEEFYRNLSKDHKTVWILWGAGMGRDVTETAHAYYDVDHKSTYGWVGVAKLTRKE